MQSDRARGRQLLDLWERGVGLDRWRRDDALLSATAPPPRRLGARNTALLSLRNAYFHGAWLMTCACPACDVAVEFEVDSAILAESLAGLEAAASGTVSCHGRLLTARPATIDDLRAAASTGTIEAAGRMLLERCVSGDIDVSTLDGAMLDQLGHELEALDPAAIIAFELVCPDCGHAWPAPIDIAETFWSEVRSHAERLFLDVDALARVYGWTEDQVLRLSPMRRAAYLQLAEAS
ncbi:hypothetical protein LB518_05085 [Mesorhizobium sp. BR1-1-16]|uniref:hypothetical protein n=1 Tax=Mesorhizobium sp. BR1-1-16 TaxID=2876653 RepID=UPI001CCE92CA|nr:hypothetical protein [Mesorhizobium sp. BR1-1-16]MBZ9935654.1 hypothetical protein [Mesorhizobium sp. BR1-1-16]